MHTKHTGLTSTTHLTDFLASLSNDQIKQLYQLQSHFKDTPMELAFDSEFDVRLAELANIERGTAD